MNSRAWVGAVFQRETNFGCVVICRDHRGRPTGFVHRAGEVWTLLTGNPDEPTIVWLRQPDGKQHTWDDDTLLDWFESASTGERP